MTGGKQMAHLSQPKKGWEEELKARQPKGSWIKLSGNCFQTCGWRGEGEQPAWIYEG